MADSTLWWLTAGGLIVVELLTGTFYFLMISAGLIAAALGAHAGLDLTWQWMTAALVGGGLVLLWRRLKNSRRDVARASANHDVNIDIGETVQVQQWADNGTCTVKYRGALWDARLLEGETAHSGSFTIVEIIGSRLILKSHHTL